jgi:hypothetical protein
LELNAKIWGGLQGDRGIWRIDWAGGAWEGDILEVRPGPHAPVISGSTSISTLNVVKYAHCHDLNNHNIIKVITSKVVGILDL